MSAEIPAETVEALVVWFHSSTMACAHRGDAHECVLRARALLASKWFAAAHDALVAEVREEIAREIEATCTPSVLVKVCARCKQHARIARGDS